MYFDVTGNWCQFMDLNMGYDWTFSQWFYAYSFNTIYSIQNGSGQTIFECKGMLVDGQNVVGVTIVYTISGATANHGSDG
jgi:multimeric flavodoxin WrbA